MMYYITDKITEPFEIVLLMLIIFGLYRLTRYYLRYYNLKQMDNYIREKMIGDTISINIGIRGILTIHLNGNGWSFMTIFVVDRYNYHYSLKDPKLIDTISIRLRQYKNRTIRGIIRNNDIEPIPNDYRVLFLTKEDLKNNTHDVLEYIQYKLKYEAS